jgi:hypothetical protein
MTASQSPNPRGSQHVDLCHASEPYALLRACRHTCAGPCASEDDAKRVMEEELVALRARLDEERALRQREAEEHEQQRLADLQVVIVICTLRRRP